MSNFKTHETFYTECRRGRAVYRPDCSPGIPFVLYRDGTATMHKATLEECVEYFKGWKMKLVVAREVT